MPHNELVRIYLQVLSGHHVAHCRVVLKCLDCYDLLSSLFSPECQSQCSRLKTAYWRIVTTFITNILNFLSKISFISLQKSSQTSPHSPFHSSHPHLQLVAGLPTKFPKLQHAILINTQPESPVSPLHKSRVAI